MTSVEPCPFFFLFSAPVSLAVATELVELLESLGKDKQSRLYTEALNALLDLAHVDPERASHLR